LKTILGGCFFPRVPDEKEENVGVLSEFAIKLGIWFFYSLALFVVSQLQARIKLSTDFENSSSII